MPRCIVHVGMHKTGTTAIQDALSELDDSEFFYARIGNGPNHSIPLFALFSGDAGALNRVNRQLHNRGIDAATYLSEVRQELDSSIERAGSRTLIISGEDLAYLSPQGLHNLKAYLEPHYTDIQIIGYVRPPAGYMTSAFQEMVRNGTLARLELPSLYRSYRSSFEKFDDIFGKAAVRLIKYDRESLANGDAVYDFVKQCGIRELTETVRSNESSSRELIAILFHYNMFCRSQGLSRVGGGQIKRVSELLTQLGNSKFRFSSDALTPILANNRADIEWMEERMSSSLSEELPAPAPGDVSSADDLKMPPNAQEVLELALERSGTPRESCEGKDALSLLHKLLTGEFPAANGDADKQAQGGSNLLNQGKKWRRMNREERPRRDSAAEGEPLTVVARRRGRAVQKQFIHDSEQVRYSIPELKKNPRPLVNIDKKLMVLWSPKSACTSVYVWFSHVSGFSSEVEESRFPHRHRIEQFYFSDLYKRSMEADLTGVNVLKVIRDPYSRAVSMYRHALKTRIIHEIQLATGGSTLLATAGMSFQFFLDYLSDRTPEDVNVHLRPQFHPIERLYPPNKVINISKSDLFSELNRFSEGMSLPAVGSGDLNWLHKLESSRRAGQVSESQDELDLVKFNSLQAKEGASFPSYAQLLSETARRKIEKIFEADFNAYANWI